MNGTHQPFSRSINQSINQTVNQLSDHHMHQRNGQLINRSVCCMATKEDVYLLYEIGCRVCKYFQMRFTMFVAQSIFLLWFRCNSGLLVESIFYSQLKFISQSQTCIYIYIYIYTRCFYQCSTYSLYNFDHQVE